MKLHERTLLVQKASAEMGMAIIDIVQKYDLTYGEVFGILGQSINDFAKYLKREERHPEDPEKKGDEE
jgi:hypothetical protein